MKSPKIRFKGFDGDWEQRKLSELATMHARIGWQNLRTSEFLDAGDYMLITGTDFEDGKVNYSTCHYVEKERYDQDKNIQIKNGNILITKDGTLGKVAYVEGLSLPATLNAGVFNVEVKDENETDSKYLFQFLKAPFLMDYVSKKATGGTIKHLNQNILVDFPIAMPNKAEQVRIGEYFSNLDNLITLHQKKCEQLTILKKYMLQKMFPQNGSDKPEIRFDGFTDDWEQRKLGWLVDNDVIEAPKDGNHGEKHPTSDEYVEEGIPFLMASDIRNGRVDLENCKYITKERAEQLDKGFAQEGDVLLTHKATIGEVAILEGLQEEYAMLTPQVTYYRILDNKRLSQKYLYAVFHSESFQNEMQTKAAQSTRPYIGISAQQNLTISLPCSTEEQQRIGEYFASLDTLITLHQNKCNELKELKKFMLQNMFV